MDEKRLEFLEKAFSAEPLNLFSGVLELIAEVRRLQVVEKSQRDDIEAVLARPQEIIDWLHDDADIGTGWQCECGWSQYHAIAPFCHECGREAPLIHQVAFKLHATAADIPKSRYDQQREEIARLRAVVDLTRTAVSNTDPSLEAISWKKLHEALAALEAPDGK